MSDISSFLLWRATTLSAAITRWGSAAALTYCSKILVVSVNNIIISALLGSSSKFLCEYGVLHRPGNLFGPAPAGVQKSLSGKPARLALYMESGN